jgi:hypothetical protein
MSQGDPFLGGLIKFGGSLIGKVTGLGGGGGIGKKELEQALKDRLGAGVGAAKGAAMGAVKFVGKHKGMSAAAAAAIAAGAIPAGYILTHSGKVRRKPHMQVTNTRALRRSMRRVQGFAKIARRTMTFTHTHKLKKHRRR